MYVYSSIFMVYFFTFQQFDSVGINFGERVKIEIQFFSPIGSLVVPIPFTK